MINFFSIIIFGFLAVSPIILLLIWIDLDREFQRQQKLRE